MNDSGVILRYTTCVVACVERARKLPVVADLLPGPSTGFLLPDVARGLSADHAAQRGGFDA